MEGALLLDEGDEPGLTPAQALAADVAAKEAAGMVGAAAAAGTIVAWMYGDGLADSGSAGAVDTDEVSLSARWVIVVVAAVLNVHSMAPACNASSTLLLAASRFATCASLCRFSAGHNFPFRQICLCVQGVGCGQQVG